MESNTNPNPDRQLCNQPPKMECSDVHRQEVKDSYDEPQSSMIDDHVDSCQKVQDQGHQPSVGIQSAATHKDKAEILIASSPA